MGKYQIATPGGFEVEVSADSEAEALKFARANWQTMPRIIGKFDGDVRVFEKDGKRYAVSPGFSTVDQDQIDQIMAGTPLATVSKRSIQEGILSDNPVTSRAAELVRGTPFLGSYMDEAVGQFAGPDAAIGLRALSGAMKDVKPIETTGLNVLGGLAGAGAMAAAAPPGIAAALAGSGGRIARTARGLLSGAGAGAAEGAVYGAGEGTGDERAQEAGKMAAIGGTFGGLLGAGAPLAKEAISNVIGRFKRSDVRTIAREFDISPEAARVIRNTFQQGGDIDAAQLALARAGDEGMLADAGPAAQALLDAATSSGGRAAETARSAIDARMNRSGSRLSGQLDTLLGAPAAGPKTAAREVQQATAEPRRLAFDDAFSRVIDYNTEAGRRVSKVVDAIDPGVLSRAIDDANQEISLSAIQKGADIPSPMPGGAAAASVRQLHALKGALDRMAEAEVNPLTGIMTPKGRTYSGFARELRNAVKGAVPEYGDALKVGGDAIAERNAFLLGEAIPKASTRVEDIALSLGGAPSAAQLASAKRGLRTEIDRLLGEVRRIPSDPNIDARQTIAGLRALGSDNVRAKVRAVMGPDAEALLRSVDEASASAEVRAAMARNSQTAVRQNIQADIADITAPGPVGHALEGEPINTTKALIQAATGRTPEYSAAQRQGVYQDIVRALTERQGPDAQASLGVLKKAMSGQELTEKQTSDLANLMSGVLFGVGQQGLTRYEGTQR